MSFKYRKLKGRIVEKFGTQGKFAEAINMSEQNVSRKMNSTIAFSTQDIELWCVTLDISKAEIGDYFFT